MGTQLPKKKRAQPHPIFGPFLLWSNSWIDQDATWYGGKPRPRRRCVRWGRNSPHLKGAQPPVFASCLLWPRSPISATAELLFNTPLLSTSSSNVSRMVRSAPHLTPKFPQQSSIFLVLLLLLTFDKRTVVLCLVCYSDPIFKNVLNGYDLRLMKTYNNVEIVATSIKATE